MPHAKRKLAEFLRNLLRHVYMGQDNDAVLIFAKHRKLRDSSHPMLSGVKANTIPSIARKVLLGNCEFGEEKTLETNG